MKHREKLVQDLRDLGTQSDEVLKERWRYLYGQSRRAAFIVLS
jgi:hypothetical protein